MFGLFKSKPKSIEAELTETLSDRGFEYELMPADLQNVLLRCALAIGVEQTADRFLVASSQAHGIPMVDEESKVVSPDNFLVELFENTIVVALTKRVGGIIERALKRKDIPKEITYGIMRPLMNNKEALYLVRKALERREPPMKFEDLTLNDICLISFTMIEEGLIESPAP